MDSMPEIGLLLDFYGELLTERQFEILDLHYNNDYSLGEISEQLDITRQGVYDNIKRGRKILHEFEGKLHLVEKYLEHRKKSEEIIFLLKSFDTGSMDDRDRDKLLKVEEGIREIISRI
jgi:predicted DNA-binding protein YlxM (UPF0122 family)